MKFEIESKFDIGDVVTLESFTKVKICNIKLDKSNQFVYLLEFEDEERIWREEYAMDVTEEVTNV
jgi:hypothetical protein